MDMYVFAVDFLVCCHRKPSIILSMACADIFEDPLDVDRESDNRVLGLLLLTVKLIKT